jgi:hypothetical protein
MLIINIKKCSKNKIKTHMNVENISKEQFEKATNNHPPNWLVKFYWKYFSTDTITTDKWVSKALFINLIILFWLGFFATILHGARMLIGIPTIIYSVILVLICIPGFIAFKMNQWRTKKIAKELKISIEDYNLLVLLYG